MNPYFVSIIIPTYNDWMRLSKCLYALAQQNYSNENFEIIVVNNDPDDQVPDGYSIPENCSVISEEKPGSYAARNTALKIARGEIIGFTDSDCIPDNNWIKNAVNYFDTNKTCSRIAGKISIFCETSPPNSAQLYDKLYAFNQKGYADMGTGVTANLFTYKHVFETVGYFNDTLLSGGDFMWGLLANEKGYKIDYVENVIINHPARNSLKELVKKEKRVGTGQAEFLEGHKNGILNLLVFLKHIRPRLTDVKFIWSKGKDLSFGSKIYICLLRRYLLSMRAYTRFRMQLKKTNRT